MWHQVMLCPSFSALKIAFCEGVLCLRPSAERVHRTEEKRALVHVCATQDSCMKLKQDTSPMTLIK